MITKWMSEDEIKAEIWRVIDEYIDYPDSVQQIIANRVFEWTMDCFFEDGEPKEEYGSERYENMDDKEFDAELMCYIEDAVVCNHEYPRMVNMTYDEYNGGKGEDKGRAPKGFFLLFGYTAEEALENWDIKQEFPYCSDAHLRQLKERCKPYIKKTYFGYGVDFVFLEEQQLKVGQRVIGIKDVDYSTPDLPQPIHHIKGVTGIIRWKMRCYDYYFVEFDKDVNGHEGGYNGIPKIHAGDGLEVDGDVIKPI